LVAARVLAALEPAALELSLVAADDLEQERERLHRNWHQQVERARYEAERARRQYDAVEPDYAQSPIMLSPGRPGPAIAALSSYLAPSAL